MQGTISTQAVRLLTQLVSRIAARVPSARGSVSTNLINGVSTVCASFLKSLEADTIDLCVAAEAVPGGMSVSADLVRGGSGEVLSEMASVVIGESADVDSVVRAIEEYVSDQTDAIAGELR